MSVVTSTQNSNVTGETALEKERAQFRELRWRLINTLLNRIFDLRPTYAVQRMQYLTFLFLLSGVIITLLHREYSLSVWAQHLQTLFLYLFNPAYAASYGGNAVNDFITFTVGALTDPRSVQYIPIFLAPFFIALQTAALYLADIFELEDVSIARGFIWEVALSGSDETIRIKQGEISEEHRQSSNYLIGGPGKVIVDIDSVALFERPDGTPHVIGPTGREPGGKATLEGFERFRQAIDIRDHYVDLRDQDNKTQSVKSRSRDGIPITATDVRLVFSVFRGENAKPSNQYPYPFSPEAVERIVYNATSRVTPDAPNPSHYEFSWINNMIGLIRGRLGGFMSSRKLSDYLASIGMPEFERARQVEQQIAEEVRKLAQQTDEPPPAKEVKPPPDFTPRHIVTNLFSQFTEEFTASTRKSGVELHWIGVGTWKTPPQIDIVPEKHLEAWKQTQDNLKNGSEEALKKAETAAILEKMESLIGSVPLAVYDDITDTGMQSKMGGRKDAKKKTTGGLKLRPPAGEGMSEMLALLNVFQDRQSNSSEYYELDHDGAMKLLLLEYRKQLIEAVDFMKARNETVPPRIEDAIKLINEQAGWSHWVGS